jgi:hypothetical protein
VNPAAWALCDHMQFDWQQLGADMCRRIMPLLTFLRRTAR